MRAPVGFSLALFVAACTGGGGDDDGAPDAAALSASCMEATTHSDLAWIEDNVFTRSCTFMACHGATTPARGLDLRAGMAHAALVGQPSAVLPSMTLVVPGNPAASYLLVALGQYPGTLPEGGTMPLQSPVLCAEKRDAIERWIAGGALP